MKKNERLDALKLLIAVLQNKTPLSTNNLSPLSQELCFGVCRHYYRLSIIADHLVKKRPKTSDIWICLLMGLYQLHYLRIPDYAVVKETVALLEQLKKTWAKGFVNAILRTFCREQDTLLAKLQSQPDFLYGHPDWFIERLKKAWPDAWQTILKANDEHPPMSLRVNARHTSTASYLERLQAADISGQPSCYAPQGVLLTKPCDVQKLPGFAKGDVSVQDQAAQLATTLLALKPGLRVLDACAAPGGKTCHIVESEPNLSACVALDIDDKRLKRIQENLNRLHLQATIVKGDALQPKIWWDGIVFDRILLDAPCSATGVIRRHPDIKLLRTEADIATVTQLQHDLLCTLWPLLKAGGIMVYATCSIMPEENERQISQFIAKHTDCKFSDQKIPWGHATGHGWQIFPGENDMDGFFYSVLVKMG